MSSSNDSWFSFSDDPDKGKTLAQNKLKIPKSDLDFRKYSFVSTAAFNNPNRNRVFLNRIYTWEIEEQPMIISTDGRRLHYVPYSDEGDHIWEIERFTKDEIIWNELEEQETYRKEAPNFSMIIVQKDSMIDTEPLLLEGSTYTLELLLAYIGKLTGNRVVFPNQQLLDFVNNVYRGNYIHIWFPKDVGSAVRLERRTYHDELECGMVVMPLQQFDQVGKAPDIYAPPDEEEKDDDEEELEIENISNE